jgi:hypothetical protein
MQPVTGFHVISVHSIVDTVAIFSPSVYRQSSKMLFAMLNAAFAPRSFDAAKQRK